MLGYVVWQSWKLASTECRTVGKEDTIVYNEVPGNAWRRAGDVAFGIGHDLTRIFNPMFYTCIAEYLSCVGFLCFSPLLWHKSRACQFPKPSDNGRMFQIRLVYSLCPFGTAFYFLMIERSQVPRWTHGYVKGRGRGSAVGVVLCVGQRLSENRNSNVLSLHEITHVFMSIAVLLLRRAILQFVDRIVSSLPGSDLGKHVI